MSDGRGQQSGAGGRRRYRVAGSGDWAAEATRGERDGGGSGGHVDDLVAGYALGALEPAERERVERHVRACPACSRLVTDDARVAGFLPYLAPAVAPPLDVKAALFARIAHAERAVTEAPRRPAPGATTPAATLPASRPLAPAVAAGGMVPSLPAERGWGPRLAWATSLLSVPLLLALVAVGAWGYQMRGEAAEADARLTEVQAQYASFVDGQILRLDPTESRGAEGTITVSADGQRLLVDMQVNNPKRDRTYQLLVTDGDRVVPQKDLRVDEDGKVREIVVVDDRYRGFESIEVKAKPASGENSSESIGRLVIGDVGGSIGETDPNSNSVLP